MLLQDANISGVDNNILPARTGDDILFKKKNRIKSYIKLYFILTGLGC